MTRLVQVSILLAWTLIASAQTRLDTLNTLRPQASSSERVMIESEMAALIARAAPDSALALANQALVQTNALADGSLLGYARYQLGMVHYVRAEYEQAIAMYMQAIPLLRAANNSLALSYAYNRLGSAYQRGGRIDEARTAFAEAVRQLEQRGDLTGAALCPHESRPAKLAHRRLRRGPAALSAQPRNSPPTRRQSAHG
jgi:tetratricopeptide (TPR) repeat protein